MPTELLTMRHIRGAFWLKFSQDLSEPVIAAWLALGKAVSERN